MSTAKGSPSVNAQYCGLCERNGCEANAKAGPHVCVLPKLREEPKFTLRTRSWVSRLIYDKAARKVTGVVYTDTRSGEEYEQPAGIVVLSAYVFGNVSLLLHSGIGEQYDPVTGKGAVGKNYCYQLSRMGVTLYFEDKELQSVHGCARRRRSRSTTSTATISTTAGSVSSAARSSLAATTAAARSATARFRPARRVGARRGRKRRPSGTSTRSTSRWRARTTPTATTISISIRSTKISSVGRCCA